MSDIKFVLDSAKTGNGLERVSIARAAYGWEARQYNADGKLVRTHNRRTRREIIEWGSDVIRALAEERAECRFCTIGEQGPLLCTQHRVVKAVS